VLKIVPSQNLVMRAFFSRLLCGTFREYTHTPWKTGSMHHLNVARNIAQKKKKKDADCRVRFARLRIAGPMVGE
jgi:hypothetical protein